MPAHSLAVEQLQKVLLGGRAQSWLSYFLPKRKLVDICKLHFPACEFHLSDKRVLCKAIYSHIVKDKENISGRLFSRRWFLDQERILFICSMLMRVLLSLIPTAYQDTVE